MSNDKTFQNTESSIQEVLATNSPTFPTCTVLESKLIELLLHAMVAIVTLAKNCMSCNQNKSTIITHQLIAMKQSQQQLNN
jgi:hypothetical protein